MGDYQLVVLQGNVGSDPVATTLPSGTEGSRFSMAVNRVFTDSNGNQQKRKTWFRVYVTNYAAPACNQHLYKGRSVLVQGYMRADENGNPRMYTVNGEQRCSFEINAQIVNFGHDLRQAPGPQQTQGHASQQPQRNEPDLPF